MSMIAVNKELINRVQEKQKTATAKKDTGPVTKEDTSTSILNKMYTFFVQGSERDKRNYEIQKDFAEERALESKRRKTTAKRRPTASKIDPKKPSSNPILDLLGFIGKGIGSIFGFLTGGLFGLISKGLGAIKDVFMKIPGFNLLGGLLGFLSKVGISGISALFNIIGTTAKLVGLVTDVVMWIGKFGAKFASAIVSITYNVIKSAGGLIFKVIWPLLSKVLQAAGSLSANALGVAGRIISNPIGAAVAAAGIGYEYLKEGGGAEQERRQYFGDEVVDLLKKKEQLEKEKEIAGTSTRGSAKNPELVQQKQKEIDEIDAKIPAAYDKYLNDVVAPAMAAEGYTMTEKNDGESKARFIAFEKTDPQTGKTETVNYRISRDAVSPEGKVTSSLTSTQEHLNAKSLVGVGDQTIIEGAIAKKKGGDYISQQASSLGNDAEDVKNKLVSEAETMTGISSSDVESFTSRAKDIGSSVSNFVTSGSETPPTSTASPAPSTTQPTPQVSVPSESPTASPAPSEKPEDDSATPTPDTTQPSMVTPAAPPPMNIPTLSDMSDNVEVGTTKVVNMPSQSAASTSQTEYSGPTNVRNPNPVVYRTAMRNDQTQP